MSTRPFVIAWMLALTLVLTGVMVVAAHDGADHGPPPDSTTSDVGVRSVTAACPGGPTIDGLLLDECVTRTFPVGGVDKTIKVYYTKVMSTTPRMEDGVNYNLQHWINSDAEAEQVAAWFQDAWQRFHTDSGHHLYDDGCSNTINVQMEDGIGWSGIAYWGSSGNCRIGIDSPMVRGGGGQSTVYHEAQHYLQYSYNDGCYGYLKPNYPDDSEFIEGYADLGADSVNAASDAEGYGGATYNSTTSMYAKSYGNIFNKYFIERLGTIGSVSDAWHRIDALYQHYTECDDQNTLYVLDTLIPALGGLSEREFFLNFFAANWAKDWADPATQPELIYLDDDGDPFGNLATLTQDVNMAGGVQSWSDATPDQWAARYYQVKPQAGCPYVQMEVDGAPGAQLGINFMAAKTTVPTKVLRSAKIGEDYIRTFAADGAFNRLVAGVNSFSANYNFDVSFTCVTPALTILEPRQVKIAMVGEPASPISFLARWKVTDGASSVRGLPESSFTFDAAGDPITVVPGSFQEVGDEYWAILLPPVKPAGTTFVNFRITLDGSISAQETNALLYVAPGNSDIALSFDASGSMNTEDTIGEGTRLTNAKKAGQVIADLLRAGDRILVQDWSAVNNPPGCGLPPDGSGDGNCPLDVITRLARTDINAGNLVAVITNARTQINNITAREWTPVGGGIVAAKDALLNLPSNLNPKHIFLLSDGRENVKPLYADIKANLVASGVVVNTIGLGPEAPGNLLAQIAADTGGVYRPVATSATGAGLRAATGADATTALAAINAPTEMAQALAAPFLPGQLGLANVYDYLDTEAQGAARIIHLPYTNVGANTWQTTNVNIDKSVNQLRLVVAGKQPDDEVCPGSDTRRVEVLRPGDDPQKRWIPISPRNSTTPAEWEIRNNRFDDVLIVTNPAEGQWSFRTQYFPLTCIGKETTDDAVTTTTDVLSDGTQADAAPLAGDAVQVAEGIQAIDSATGAPYAFFMNISVQSTIQLEGRLLGLDGGQGLAGDVVTIIGALLDKNGAVPAQLMVAFVEGPDGTDLMVLKDDGTQNDGSAGDGIYGALFGNTAYGGGYSVRILAGFKDPANPANSLIREWNGGFWIDGPKLDPSGGQQCGGPNDTDKDCMPDDWERRCKLIVGKDDRGEDPDRDGLNNYEELQHGTLPCRADTDNGGENDGSEVRNQRNPLDPKDDKVAPLGKINVRALNARIMIEWARPFSYTNMLLFVSQDPNNPGRPTRLGQGDPNLPGNHMIEGLENGKTYYLWLQGENGTALGDTSEPEAAMPKTDPDMPSGAMIIENGSDVAHSKQVMLNFSATDTPLPGAAQGSAAHLTDRFSTMYNDVSGNIQMRVANHEDMAGAQWQSLVQELPWTLECANGDLCRVYAQFRDAALNESLIVNDTILLQ
ncbi:MAG: hypothetical protein KAX65_03745, partial [Caldilineaceae bacterium]|nr:hypothetical protein [Caldilineaceae bacterium]